MEKKSVFEEVSRSDPFEQRVSKDEGEIRKRNQMNEKGKGERAEFGLDNTYDGLSQKM